MGLEGETLGEGYSPEELERLRGEVEGLRQRLVSPAVRERAAKTRQVTVGRTPLEGCLRQLREAQKQWEKAAADSEKVQEKHLNFLEMGLALIHRVEALRERPGTKKAPQQRRPRPGAVAVVAPFVVAAEPCGSGGGKEAAPSKGSEGLTGGPREEQQRPRDAALAREETHPEVEDGEAPGPRKSEAAAVDRRPGSPGKGCDEGEDGGGNGGSGSKQVTVDAERITDQPASVAAKMAVSSSHEATKMRSSVSSSVPPPSTGVKKTWHGEVTLEERQHLALSFAENISLSNDSAATTEKLKAYTRQIEEDMFELGNSKAEYHRLMAEKLHALYKKLDQKLRSPSPTRGVMGDDQPAFQASGTQLPAIRLVAATTGRAQPSILPRRSPWNPTSISSVQKLQPPSCVVRPLNHPIHMNNVDSVSTMPHSQNKIQADSNNQFPHTSTQNQFLPLNQFPASSSTPNVNRFTWEQSAARAEVSQGQVPGAALPNSVEMLGPQNSQLSCPPATQPSIPWPEPSASAVMVMPSVQCQITSGTTPLEAPAPALLSGPVSSSGLPPTLVAGSVSGTLQGQSTPLGQTSTGSTGSNLNAAVDPRITPTSASPTAPSGASPGSSGSWPLGWTPLSAVQKRFPSGLEAAEDPSVTVQIPKPSSLNGANRQEPEEATLAESSEESLAACELTGMEMEDSEPSHKKQKMNPADGTHMAPFTQELYSALQKYISYVTGSVNQNMEKVGDLMTRLHEPSNQASALKDTEEAKALTSALKTTLALLKCFLEDPGGDSVVGSNHQPLTFSLRGLTGLPEMLMTT